MYTPDWESLATHRLPVWYDDAKLGIFIHWGLYSVPGWAPQVADVQQQLKEAGPAYLLRENPYAEWYLNSSRLTGSPTWRHQRETYGPDATYDDFVDPFDRGTAEADMAAIAAACRDAGAGYVVLTAKHHDGFCLWPTRFDIRERGRYHAARDIVADLRTAVLDVGMRMGLYYSGGYDWPYNDALLENPADVMLAVPHARLRRLCHRACNRAHRAVSAVGVVERHLLARRRRPGRTVRPLLQRRAGRHHQRSVDRIHCAPWRGHRCRGPRGRTAGPAVLVDHSRRIQVADLPRQPPFRHPHPGIRHLRLGPGQKWESTRGVGHSFEQIGMNGPKTS